MDLVTCPACSYDYVTPLVGPAGPCCPRCAEPLPPSAGNRTSAVELENYLSAAVGGAALGLLAAAALLLSR